MRDSRLGVRAAILLALAGVAATPALADPPDQPIPDEAMVRLLPGVTIAQFNARYGTTTIGTLATPNSTFHRVHLPTPMTEEEWQDLVEEDPQGVLVEWTELHWLVNDDVGGGTQSFFLGYTVGQYESQQALVRVNQPAALGAATGQGVVVAVIDTGVDASHPALAGAIAPGGYNFHENNANTADLGDGLDNDGNGQTDEMVGHGTFMAGIILAVAPDATILPIRCLDSDGRGTSFRIAQGIYHAIAMGADVINLSLGGEKDSDLIDDAVHDARYFGVLVVASAGNDGQRLELYPASSRDPIGVAALDPTDRRASFTNYNEELKISAPGVAVVSSMPGSAYARGDGSSCAAAIVSGAAAILRDRAPYLRQRDFEDALEESADSIAAQNPGFAQYLGEGRLDIAGALNYLPDCPADLTATAVAGAPGYGVPDGVSTNDDFFYYLALYAAHDPRADLTGSAINGTEEFGDPDGVLNSDDFFYYLFVFDVGCG